MQPPRVDCMKSIRECPILTWGEWLISSRVIRGDDNAWRENVCVVYSQCGSSVEWPVFVMFTTATVRDQTWLLLAQWKSPQSCWLTDWPNSYRRRVWTSGSAGMTQWVGWREALVWSGTWWIHGCSSASHGTPRCLGRDAALLTTRCQISSHSSALYKAQHSTSQFKFYVDIERCTDKHIHVKTTDVMADLW